MEKARLQTLTDAVIAAQLAAQQIPPDEHADICSFGQFDDGGWWWRITTSRRGIYGNTKDALPSDRPDYRDQNMREVIASGMTALARGSARTTDHLHEAIQNDSKIVMEHDRGDGKLCRGCGRPLGAYHETGCTVAYPRARAR